MTRKLALISLIALTLAACTTTPPTAEELNAKREARVAKLKARPEIFKGRTGFTSVHGTTKVLKTNIMRGEEFISRQVNFRRTGTLQADAKYGNFIVNKTIPAGAQLYASSYGFNRIGWCYPGKDNANLGESFMGKATVFCILGSLTGSSAELMRGSGGSSAFFTPKLVTPGMPGPVPDILEEKVDFGRTFTSFMRVNRVKNKHIIIASVLHDGIKRVQMGTHKIRRAEDGSAILRIWGGEIKVIPNTDPKSKQISLEVIKTPDDTDDNIAVLNQLLQMFLEDPANKAVLDKAIEKRKQELPTESPKE
ncbi:MAG: hypothetical protein COA91_05485 [Robiginitomaculum sp.]|nr:MAG: hypothetical protein COA91_05485 [Robiginitomaculum sp.]